MVTKTAERVAAAPSGVRRERIETAVHSAAMEGLAVTEEWREDAADYVAGEIDESELVERTRARYGLV
ncbi:hypothetical protein EDF36_3121 [Rathayibacter sp. PhB152]|jgi:hypothetical protein|uniref:antitoxin VbhA family protein n=1 Tax=unclassified Rathayibacter TaxID=2609250 RepID=UPI000F4B263B|nr:MULTISPECIES: antitoxin VbhA family protein [unclassified Rathayibacter]ROQ56072.1 hypothetical protein EDF36_3121 [Rathayibacter sp. PhB152]TDX76060.1 hypothetical protein EDF35_3599 [Rathayibacter sp. PhB151]